MSLAAKRKLCLLSLFPLCRALNFYSFFAAFPRMIADFLQSLTFTERGRIVVRKGCRGAGHGWGWKPSWNSSSLTPAATG